MVGRASCGRRPFGRIACQSGPSDGHIRRGRETSFPAGVLRHSRCVRIACKTSVFRTIMGKLLYSPSSRRSPYSRRGKH